MTTNPHLCSHDNDLPVIDPQKITSQEIQAIPLFDSKEVFNLVSNPEALHTIYLDFTGHTTANTLWNTSFNRPTITTPAFSQDKDANFSEAERGAIYSIWARVAEDFAPFNVNVTTIEPPVEDLIKTSGGTDKRWGIRVCVGGSSDWYGSSAGGVAFVDSFNWTTDIPAFVFTTQLGNGNEKFTAEAISHEIGHSLGLSHDGRKPSEGYYFGQGDGETGWAPLLGAGYYKSLTQWSRGGYANASNTEDDLQIITTRNGFGYRADDVGNTIVTARPLTVVDGGFTAHGIIEQNTDVDFYCITVGAANITITVAPNEIGANLDILAELYDSSGVLIQSTNPNDQLATHIQVSLGAGTYYLKIDGVGKGDPLTTGYSDYGSLGQYCIKGVVQVVDQPPLVLPAVTINDVIIAEGSSPSTCVFTIRLSEASSLPVTLDYEVKGISATEGVDFKANRGRIVIAPGVLEYTLAVPIVGDVVVEGDETFCVDLNNVVNATLADNQGIGTITNDDTAPLPSLGIGDITVIEGNKATFTVSLSSPTTQTIWVNYVTSNGTATAGSDYVRTSGRLILYAGFKDRAFTIPTLLDSEVEGDETFTVTLSNAINASIGRATAVGLITAAVVGQTTPL